MPATSKTHGKTSVVKLLCVLVVFPFKIISVSAQGSCNANEYWMNCVNTVCSVKTCDELGYPLNCTSPTAACVGGCICVDQYLRNSENQCIPVAECPSCAGDFNATAGSGTHCGNLCSNYKQVYVFCIEKPTENTCECRKGYVFNDRIGKCIHPDDCPKPCRGDHYAEEKECAAPIQPTCAKPRVDKSNECRPPGSCECVYPYVLHKSGGKCVRYDTCPEKFSIEAFFPTPSPSEGQDESNIYVSASGLTGPELASRMEVGTRVVRGRDWMYGDEDGGKRAQGTVVRGLLGGFVRVEWDNEKINSYRMGIDNKYDLNIPDSPTTPQTTSPEPTTSITGLSGPELASVMKLDTQVVRGKDWQYGDEDGGKGSKGTIVRELAEGFVRVEWDTGKTNSYRMGSDNKYDLDLADPPQPTTTTTISGPELAARMQANTRVVKGRDWEYDDQDGGKGSIGTVVNGLSEGWVRVEWDTGRTNSYRMGHNDKFDLDLADPSSTPPKT